MAENSKEAIGVKELFDMVYQWGRVGVVCDYTCPAYQDTVNDIIRKQALSLVEIDEERLRELINNTGLTETLVKCNPIKLKTK